MCQTVAQKLANHGIMMKRDARGMLCPHCWTEQNGGVWVPCQLAANSEGAELVRQVLAGTR